LNFVYAQLFIKLTYNNINFEMLEMSLTTKGSIWYDARTSQEFERPKTNLKNDTYYLKFIF